MLIDFYQGIYIIYCIMSLQATKSLCKNLYYNVFNIFKKIYVIFFLKLLVKLDFLTMDYLTKLNDLKYRNLKIKGSLKTRIDLQKVLTKEIEENMINSK